MGLRAQDLGRAHTPSPAHACHHPRGGGSAHAWTVHNWETGERKPEIRFIPALVEFLGYDPEPADEGTLAGRLIAKRRELGLSQREAARSLAIDSGTWAGWEKGVRIKREGQRRKVERFLGAVSG
jgi:DNA-binding XRE family transcriptional regulator